MRKDISDFCSWMFGRFFRFALDTDCHRFSLLRRSAPAPPSPSPHSAMGSRSYGGITSRTFSIVLFAILGLALSDALADKVVLSNGNTFEGEILEETEKGIVLKMKYGTMTFRKEQIKSVTRGRPKPSKPPTPPPTDTPSADTPAAKAGKASTDPEVARLMTRADVALKARQFAHAIELLKQAREVASANAPTYVKPIDIKLKKIQEQLTVAVEIKIEKVFMSENVRDPAVRGSRKAEDVPDDAVRRDIESSLLRIVQAVLKEKGFIPTAGRRAGRRRTQSLVVTYTEAGGVPYLDNAGQVVGHRIHATVTLQMLAPSGGPKWSQTVEAITPGHIRRGTTRSEMMNVLAAKLAALTFGL